MKREAKSAFERMHEEAQGRKRARKPAEELNGLEPGTRVICSYRRPPESQPWLHPVWVGTVEAAGNDPAYWNGTNSEAVYCELTGTTRVKYSWGVAHDLVADLERTEATADYWLKGAK